MSSSSSSLPEPDLLEASLDPAPLLLVAAEIDRCFEGPVPRAALSSATSASAAYLS
jgi:hypothetical protein